jgi:hypothetical protein
MEIRNLKASVRGEQLTADAHLRPLGHVPNHRWIPDGKVLSLGANPEMT